MKELLTMLALASPAAAQPMGMPAGPGACEPMLGTLMTAASYALVAAVGYWVLQHADKETHNCVKRTGVTVGALLIILGLLGFICGLANHIRMAAAPSSCGGGGGHAGMTGNRPLLPPGPPPGMMMREMGGQQPPEKARKAGTGSAKTAK